MREIENKEEKLKDPDINLRSEEVQEVLGEIPPWIQRWGITLIALIVLILLIGSAMFKYPDMISASVILTGSNPPVRVVAQAGGKLEKLFVYNNQQVSAGEYLAVIDNPAHTEDIVYLKSVLNSYAGDISVLKPLLEKDLKLGSVQNTYFTFYTQLYNMNQQQREKGNMMHMQLNNSLNLLQNDIRLWEISYVLTAPVSGEVSFVNHWSENQYVSYGEAVFVIVPEQNSTMLGKAYLPAIRSGKVAAGQRVNIKFDNFPENEYGIVRGMVKSISPVPVDNTYILEIELNNGLMTTYNKELPYLPEMRGHADIVTDDLSLLERFFMPLKNIISQGMK